MPVNINFHIRLDEKWSVNKRDNIESYYRGYVFNQNQPIESHEIWDLLIQSLVGNSIPVKMVLNQLNGCFSCLIKTNGLFFACVDRARSIPIFYSQVENCLYVSNDAYWVKEKTGIEKLDNQAELEFLLTGYVTGPVTLFSGIRQLQAGEFLLVKNGDVKVDRYFRFFHHSPYLESLLFEEFDEVIHNAFERFAKWAGGRLIVIPVSGGHDSRLVATILKMLNYNNLLVFSYGKAGNKEAEISQQVAKALGIRWEFIEYTQDLWRNWFQSDQRKAYYRMADGLSSIPHLQDWPAVLEMQKRGYLPRECVFAPGHTVTMALKDRPLRSKPKSVTDAIYKKHYSLWPKMEISQEARNQLLNKIWDNICDLPMNSKNWGVDYLEAWELQERQVKFIVNSVRVYDYFGYDWYLPLWDSELIEFWRRVPTQFRIGKKLLVSYVKQTYNRFTGVLTPINDPPLKSLKRFISNTPLRPVGNQVYRTLSSKRKKFSGYRDHDLAMFGLVPEDQFNKLYTGHENIASFLCLEKLGKIKI